MLAPGEARRVYAAALRVGPRGQETVPLLAALGRALAADVVSAIDLPPFDRSTVDGWAVRAPETSAATSGHPARLRHAGEVRMGAAAALILGPGGVVRIPTGGMLPEGADAVVMQEDVDTQGDVILVRRAVRAGENIVAHGADVQAGEAILRRGRRLRAADLGILAGVGLDRVDVFLPPRVAILATGDEVIPAGAPLAAGRVRDMNSPALAGAVLAAGGIPTLCGIVGDERSAVDEALRRALIDHDMVLVSGGSSVGERDVAAAAIGALGPPGVIVHGIAVRPGKPTVLAAAGAVPVIGLPGNPVSALVIFDLFARPALDEMLGGNPASRPWALVRARLAEALPAAGAREDHRRVRLESRPDGLWARPLPAGSQILTSLARADGIVVVPASSAGFTEGEDVEVRLIS